MTSGRNTQHFDFPKNSENIVYIGNIDIHSTEEEFREFFKGINILKCKIWTRFRKCFAFIEVGSKSEADNLFHTYNGQMFKTRKLILRLVSTEDTSKTDEPPNRKASKKNSSKKSKKTLTENQINNTFKQFNPKSEDIPPLEDMDYILQKKENNSSTMNTIGCSLGNVLRNDYETVFLENGFRLFIGNFPYGTSENDLMELFHPVNPLFAVIKNNGDKKFSTQGFIFLSSIFDMKRAVEKFDKSIYKDHVLLVTSSCVGVLIRNNSQNTSESIENVQGESMLDDLGTSISFHREISRLIYIYKECSLESELLTTEIAVCVTRVINPHCFWAHVIGEKNEKSTEFMTIHKYLQKTAFGWKKTKSIGRCVAMYCGKWFRGYILNFISQEFAEVFLIDVGNIANINIQLIRLSPDSIWKLSPMARPFKIPNGFNELPENATHQHLSLVILKLETASSGYITLVKIKDDSTKIP